MRTGIAALTSLLLVGCGGSQDKAANGAAPAATPVGGGASVSFQPGQWEVTTQVTRMNIPNLPPGASPPAPPPTTVRHCMTAAEASRPNANFLTGSGESGGCSTSEFSMTGGRLHGTIQCSQQGTTMHTTIDGQFSATSYEINQRAQVSAAGMQTEVESRTTGRRVGDCPGG
jgi:hypothetical protein